MHYKIHAIDVKNALKNYIWLLEDTITKEVVKEVVKFLWRGKKLRADIDTFSIIVSG